jgi:hypothetical protein
MYNCSSAPYLICYHPPRHVVDKYGFNVKLVAQIPTSMHGSSEGHSGYIYKRTSKRKSRDVNTEHCDPLFQSAWDAVMGGAEVLEQVVNHRMAHAYSDRRVTRSHGTKMTAVSSAEEREEAEKDANKYK